MTRFTCRDDQSLVSVSRAEVLTVLCAPVAWPVRTFLNRLVALAAVRKRVVHGCHPDHGLDSLPALLRSSFCNIARSEFTRYDTTPHAHVVEAWYKTRKMVRSRSSSLRFLSSSMLMVGMCMTLDLIGGLLGHISFSLQGLSLLA